MKRIKIPGPQVSVILEDRQLKRLDGIAKRFKISRGEATRRIIDTGLDVYAVYEGLGVAKLAEISSRAKEACTGALRTV